ncbi:MAG: ATP-binding protein [Acholeplasma sp.]
MQYKKLLEVIVILTITVLISVSLSQMMMRIDTILLIYIVAILLISIEVNRLLSLASTIILAFSFNYLFVEPKYTFEIYDVNYLVSLLVFILVAILANHITFLLKRELLTNKKSQQIITSLNQLSNLLLVTKRLEDAVDEIQSIISHQIGLSVKLIIHDNITFDDHQEAVRFALTRMIKVDQTIRIFSDLQVTIYPLLNRDKKIFFIIDNLGQVLNLQQQDFLESVCFQIRALLEKEEIIIQKEKAQYSVESERFKNILLRSLSHDIKSPLTSIRSGIYLLKEMAQSKDSEEYIDIYKDINEEILRLDDFINNVLTMTQLQNDIIKISIDRESIKEFLNDIEYTFNKRYPLFNLSIMMEQKVDDFAYFDKSLLVQVFNNILDNAVKHTTGGRDIKITCHHSFEQIQFIIDNNCGFIDPNKIKTIFDESVIKTNQKGDKKRGFGLGLAIVKSIIDLHQGSIHLANNSNNGIVIDITIPNKRR